MDRKEVGAKLTLPGGFEMQEIECTPDPSKPGEKHSEWRLTRIETKSGTTHRNHYGYFLSQKAAENKADQIFAESSPKSDTPNKQD